MQHDDEQTPEIRPNPAIGSPISASLEGKLGEQTQQHKFRQPAVAPTRDLASDLIEVFKLLSDETRLRIVLLLLEMGELNVRTLCERLNQSQPAVSHHLALLRVAGFIERRREGKSNYYHVVQDKLELVICSLFRTVPGRASYLQFHDFQVEYHPRVAGIVELTPGSPTSQSSVSVSRSL